jgi:hypothetical protein
VLRRIFGPNNDEIIDAYKILHNEELYNLSSSPEIIRMIKSTRMTTSRIRQVEGSRRG